MGEAELHLLQNRHIWLNVERDEFSFCSVMRTPNKLRGGTLKCFWDVLLLKINKKDELNLFIYSFWKLFLLCFLILFKLK